jgi:hypothetical protein
MMAVLIRSDAIQEALKSSAASVVYITVMPRR